MKIVIDKKGYLSIKRMSQDKDNEVKYQYCPRFVCPDGCNSRCGDWCPLFNLVIEKIAHSKEVCVELQLCEGRVYHIEEFNLGV